MSSAEILENITPHARNTYSKGTLVPKGRLGRMFARYVRASIINDFNQYDPVYRVYKKRLNKFEITLNVAKRLELLSL